MPKPANAITEYRNYYLPPHFPILLLSGEHWKISDKPSERLHFHNCLEIGICHSEGGAMELYGERFPFHEGDVTIIPRNVPHTTYSNPGTASQWSYIYIDPKELFRHSLPSTWENYDLTPYFFKNFQYILNKEEYPTVYQLLDVILKELKAERLGYQFSVKGLLLSLYIEIYRIQSQAEEAGGEPDKGFSDSASPLSIAPALDYIENNYMRQFSIEFLADLCHWSPTHFRRIFNSIMRISPLSYVNNTRIQKSCSLLCSTDDSILSISEAVGFQSVSSYNRYFFRLMQQSPREYRRQMLQSDKQAQNMSIMKYSGWMSPEW
ncbi:MAG: AraC family transcriptional regulator [Bacillus sp. (in: Bacteria)]|nr:AraC family transcriptional regulator [Bacillus sp. (in: firmicutes)]MCM1426669.1 AraC family transcriptional regulator [Eubacterium sp.]